MYFTSFRLKIGTSKRQTTGEQVKTDEKSASEGRGLGQQKTCPQAGQYYVLNYIYQSVSTNSVIPLTMDFYTHPRGVLARHLGI